MVDAVVVSKWIILTRTNETVGSDLELGLATLCIGGGQGMAIVLERA